MNTGAGLLIALITVGGCASRSGPVMPAAILLFTGTGTSHGDVEAMGTLLSSHHLDYVTADSAQLNRMAATDLQRYRLLIVPGGNFIEMGNSLNANTTANIRNAVKGGVNYLGICAGAFLAGDFPAAYFPANDGTLNLTSGVHFSFYSASGKGIRKTPVAVTMADGRTLEHYWEDGPQLTGWGDVIGKYPDGTPAIVEGTFGSGFVILTGVHPEAPERWRHGMTFATPASADNAYAMALIRAALKRAVTGHDLCPGQGLFSSRCFRLSVATGDRLAASSARL